VPRACDRDLRARQPTADGLGVAAEHREPSFVDHGAVVEDVEHLVGLGSESHLGHQDLDLEWLDIVGEHVAQHLGVVVGQAPRVDVVAAELVALEIGGANASNTKAVELVVLAHATERDAVVDLAQLAECAARILGDEHDAVVVPGRDHGAPPGDALAREVGPVLHHLLGSDVERHAHRECTSAAIRSKTPASSSSATRSQP
jgi:hypothetical protein